MPDITAVTDYESAIDDLITAMAGDDSTAVHRYAAVALARAAKLPRVSGDGESITYDEARRAINTALTNWRHATTGSGGVIFLPVEVH